MTKEMKLLKTIKDVKSYIEQCKSTIGLVPTMGYLHEGHLSLIKRSKETCDITIVSIYVNPTQFAPNEDLDNYPRDIEKDVELCKASGVNAIFFPDNDTMYPKNYSTYVTVNNITQKLCGESRPTHFQGVTTVVSKLFNIIKPDYAFFGKKDFQQCLVIERMVKDLNFDVNIVKCSIVREADGLAKSSRNKYLSKKERSDSLILSSSLNFAKKSNIKNSKKLKSEIIKLIKTKNSTKIDYVEILNKNTLKETKEVVKNKTVIALAVFIGKTRLIDNIEL